MADLPERVPESSGTPESLSRSGAAFPIVGIGASAGGLEAITRFFSKAPGSLGMAYVVIQHLDPTHGSHLVELLAKATSMPVAEAEDGAEVVRDHVYVIPPNMSLTVEKGRLILTPREMLPRFHPTIDLFMRSLAVDRAEYAIGILLSGTGTDGTLGLAEIKAEGGITFAQDEQSAKHPGMPMNAVDEGVVDQVLPPEGIAEELAALAGHPYFSTDVRSVSRDQKDPESSFPRILAILRSEAGVDFAQYRDTTLKRRILRRMALNRMESAATYARKLRDDPAEVQALYRDFLINVTSFFRDPDLFVSLKTLVFPELHRNRSADTILRLWVAGCSTGEEAYSYAMSLVEFQDEIAVRPAIQIFATDISDSPALERARAGLYPESIASDLGPERLHRFFTKEAFGYRINREIREMVLFAKHDVTADPPFSRMDLISCRNLLIYLSPLMQRKVIPTFHYALLQTGYLVLGFSETVGQPGAELFNTVDPKLKIYGKRMTGPRIPPIQGRPRSLSAGPAHRPDSRGPIPFDYERAADRLLLRRFAPCGVLINKDLDVVQFRGRTSPYLEPPDGEAAYNLSKMASHSLYLELRSAVQESIHAGAAVVRRGVPFREGTGTRPIQVDILPVRPPDAGETCFLILFQEQEPEKGNDKVQAAPADPISQAEEESEMAHMRIELAAAHEYLQSIREQFDAVNEELKSSNEEILSSNEELQSTNEELETAKEELQSSNEELSTMNDELRNRNQELAHLNADLNGFIQYAQSIVDTVREPLLILDEGLQVHSANASFAHIFRMDAEATLGRPLIELGAGSWNIPGLKALLDGVLAKDAAFEDFECDHEFPAIGRRILQLNARRLVQGVGPGRKILLAMVDITARKIAERDLRLYKFICDLSNDPQYLVHRDGSIKYLNRSALSRLEYSEDEAQNLKLGDVDPAHVREAFALLFEHAQAGPVMPFETEHVTRNGEKFPVECSVTGLKYENDPYLLAVARDITERKRTTEIIRLGEDKLRQSQKVEAIGKLAGGVAHDFNNLLTAINGYSDLSLAMVGKGTPLHDNLAEIHKAGSRAASLTRQLLAYSRKQVLVPEVLDLNTLISDMRNMLHRVIGEGIELVIDLAPGLGAVKADRGEMEQVLLNLIVNSRDAMPNGGRILLETRNEDLDEQYTLVLPGSYAALSVRDTGTGMNQEVKARIFDPFFSTKGTGKGSGLGLSMVQGLVAQSGGHITVQSEPGAGTTFRIFLPQAGGKAGLPRAAESKTREDLRGTETILLVEDEETLRTFAHKILELHGYSVLTAHDGKAALAVLEEMTIPIHLLLTDVVMPGMSGHELGEKFLRMREGSQALFMSGYSDEAVVRHRLIEAGCRIIPKPFTPTQLAHAVRETLDSKVAAHS